MNVCIVTVYNSINSGSFWQAYALKFYIERLGHKVYFIERKISGSSAQRSRQIEKIIWEIIRGRFYSAKYLYRMYQAFNEEQSVFDIIKQEKIQDKQLSLVLLGSDTIWNLDVQYFMKNRKEYWGGSFENVEVAVYAASVGNTSMETVQKYPELLGYLGRIVRIGVRDRHTQEVISALIKCPIQLVCDPVMLLDKQEYKKMINTSLKGKYIFLYLFRELTKEQRFELIDFAKNHQLSIINGNGYVKYCDRCILNCPSLFLQYIYYAEYVITDTFHGTVFSVNLEKQFISIERNKKKVDDFLDIIAFKDRLVSERNIIKTLDQELDYAKRSRMIIDFKKRSREYLGKVLGGLK